MLQSHQLEELIELVSSLDRQELSHQFRHYRANFPVDFTNDFLTTQPLERLQSRRNSSLPLHHGRAPAGQRRIAFSLIVTSELPRVVYTSSWSHLK